MVDSIQIIQSSKLTDMVLASSTSGVSLQSPYGKQGPPGTGWVWEVPNGLENVRISDTAFVPESNVVSISLYDEANNRSRLFLVDALGGGLSSLQGVDASVDILHDELVCVAGLAQTNKTSGWGVVDPWPAWPRGRP